MPVFKRLLITILLLAVIAAGAGVLAQPGDSTALRFVHTIPGASPIDVYVDDVLTVSGLPFGEATTYINVPPGTKAIKATPSGASIALWEQTLDASAGAAYTLIAATQNDILSFAVYPDDLTTLPLGKARFTAVHAIPGAEAVDLLLEDGSPVLPGIEYANPDTSGTLDVQVLPYSMVATTAGGDASDPLVATGTLPLVSGTSYMLVIYGTPEEPQFTLLGAPTAAQGSSGAVRLVHGVPEGTDVDVYINDTLAAILAPTSSSEFIAIPAGSYDVALRATGTEQNLATATLDVAEGDYLTAAALEAEDGLQLVLFNADLSTATAEQALVRFINAGGADSTVSARLDDGTVVAEELAGGTAADLVTIAPASQGITVGISTEGGSATDSVATQVFYGGTLYEFLVAGDEVIALAPVGLAQGFGSAPGAVIPAQEQVSAEATPEVAEIAEATPEVQPTLPPPVAEAPPTVAPAADQIVGRVFNLNPDANLHLRLYPDPQAESLGLAPFGTTLIVNGRQGELIANQPATPIPPDYEYVDPATLLEDEDDDLAREETWLNVTYNTPDGGSITAWVRSDFVDVREADGTPLPLRDLPTVPGNSPGGRSNTAVGAPAPPENRVTVTVFNLNQGANLNIRRTSSENGDILGTMSVGAVADFLGINEAGDWIYLSYAAPDGCIVEGWTNAAFLSYNFRDAPVEEQELLDRGLLTIIPATELAPEPVCTGAAAAPANVQATPIRDAIVAEVALDPGANLNLRRDPNASSAVLVQVPSGTRLVVNGRSGDANWLNVTYDSSQGAITGWIAARQQTSEGIATFVRLSLNGQTYELEQVPLAEGQLETTPTATLQAPAATPVPEVTEEATPAS